MRMRKGLKTTLLVLGSLLVCLVLAGLGAAGWARAAFLSFEADNSERTDLPRRTVDGYSFIDRNANGRLDPYEDGRRDLEERVGDLISRMSVEEKIRLLKGSGLASATGMGTAGAGIPGAAGTIVPVPRLGIPTVYLSDGPAGLRIFPTRKGEDRTYYCTAFPVGTLLSSTWDVDLVQEVGSAMGREALEYGVDVILGPGANLHRHPLCGRNFEYYSEDPLLTGFIGAAMVNGIESNGVGSSVKHFAANNQETDRNVNDVRVSERALREIYLKGFELIVRKSQPWTIMSSYNKINGTYASQDRRLLSDILRKEWGFSGLVMSDWFGGNDAPAQVRAGNDLLEPGTRLQWKALRKAARDGSLSAEDIDASVRRILRLVLASRKMDGYVPGQHPDLKAHAAVARRAAAEGIVLLKNEQALPLKRAQTVALLGVSSYDLIAGGTGSGDVNEAYTVSLEQGLAGAGFGIHVPAKELFEAHRRAHAEAFVKPEGFAAMFQPYDPPEIPVAPAQMRKIAADADIAVVTIGRNSGEGGDRRQKDDFLLSAAERELIANACSAFHGVGKKVVVVLNIGGVIETASWKEQPDAIVLAWQGGQESGNALADVLSGRVNPNGKLPMTFPVRLGDHASNANFPVDGAPSRIFDVLWGAREKAEAEKVRNRDYTDYAEGIYVGYRHFDKAGKAVAYPFGFGLSYTEFRFSQLGLERSGDTLYVRAAVENAGAYAGREVLQVYVSGPGLRVERPVQELKAFAKSRVLAPGQQETLRVGIPVSELRYWDEKKGGWELEEGIYQIRVGASSRDIRLTGETKI